jgi:hypothetical protein
VKGAAANMINKVAVWRDGCWVQFGLQVSISGGLTSAGSAGGISLQVTLGNMTAAQCSPDLPGAVSTAVARPQPSAGLSTGSI